MKKLPRKLLFIKSSDKNHVETWTRNRDPLDIPGMRAVLIGKPGVGKTTVIKNMLLRTQQSDKPYKKIYILHCDPLASEYDDIGAEVLDELPPNEFWLESNREKSLVILDDISFANLSKEQKTRLDRLCGMISTHCNVSIACLNQSFFSVDPIVKKCANLFCIWRPNDLDELNLIARRCGYKKDTFVELFSDLILNDADSLMIDQTAKSPYKLRRNGYEIIKKNS